MPLSVTCPGCESVYPVGESLVGKTIRCKKCGEMITVSTPAAAKAKPARAAVEDDADDAPRKKPVRARAAVEEDEAPVKAKRPARAVVEDDDEGDDYDDAPRKGGKSKGLPVPLIVGGAVAFLVLVVGGAVGAYFLVGHDKGSDQTNANPAVGGVPSGDRPPGPPMFMPNGAAPAPGATTNPPPKTDTPSAAKTEPTKTDPVKPKETPTTGNATAQATPNTASQRPADPPTSFGLSARDYQIGKMDRITLERVKKAAVMFRVDTDHGTGEGSGWFGVEPGFVFTNAHVIGMKSPGSKEPKKITLFLNTGTPEQREIPHQRVKILAVDREIDLALIQVIGEKDLPVPLKVKPSLDLLEGQGLNTVGFPFGSMLSRIGRDRKPPEVSVRPSAFTAFRRDPFGQPRRIQIEGGVYTGNSGGAIVDAEGTVCGVVVEVWRDQLGGGQSQIGLGVPTEYVLGLLAGRIGEIEYLTPYRDSGKVHIPVKMTCQDPIGRLNKVGMAGWVGDVSDKHRKPGTEKPVPEPSDSDYQVKEFKLQKNDANKSLTATGELVLPELPPGRAYWVQPFYSNSSTPEYWMPGIRLPIEGGPVERTPVDLHAKFRPGTKRSVTMSNSSDLSEFLEGEGEAKEERVTYTSTLKVTETVHAGDTNSAAKFRLTFEEVGLKAELGGAMEQEAPKRLTSMLNQFAKLAEAWAFFNNLGEMYKYTVNTLAIRDPIGSALVHVFATDAIEALHSCSIPLPNKTVNAGEKWEAVKNVRLSVGLPRVGKSGKIETKMREYKYIDKVTYTYIGQRERAGKKEAVVLIEGKIAQAPGAKETASGTLKGMALIELDSGMVVDSKMESEFELDTSGDGQKKKLSGINKFKLTRGASAQ